MPDQQVIDGARRALVRNPAAPMSEIAQACGVGMSALYARFGSRQDLLEYFEHEGDLAYARAFDRVDERFADGWSAERVFRAFMRELVETDLHQLWLVAGNSYQPSAADLRVSARLRRRGVALVRRCHESGVLREGVAWADLFLAQLALAPMQGSTPERTRQLQLRMMEITLTGLLQGDGLPGRPARRSDFAEDHPLRRPSKRA